MGTQRDGAAHGRLHRGRPPQPRPSATGTQWAPPAPSSASSSAASTSPSASSRSPRHAHATSPSESGDQRDTHGSHEARVRPSAPNPRTTSALRKRKRCTMPRRPTPMCRAPMCAPRTWLTDQSHEIGDGRPRSLPRSRQRWPAPRRRVRPERHFGDARSVTDPTRVPSSRRPRSDGPQTPKAGSAGGAAAVQGL
jgi:hypothetical protein